MAKISPELKKQLHAIAQKQAEKIAKEFKDKMTEHYKSVLDWYYREPYQTNPPHYERTNNLRNSYIPYFKSINSKTTVLGVTAALSFKNVGRDKMYSPTCFEYADHIHNLLWIHRFRVC